MDLASAEAEIRHVFGDTPITEASIGAAPPGNNIAQWCVPRAVEFKMATGCKFLSLTEFTNAQAFFVSACEEARSEDIKLVN